MSSLFRLFLYLSAGLCSFYPIAAEADVGRSAAHYDLFIGANAGRIERAGEWHWEQSFPIGAAMRFPESCSGEQSELCAKAAGIVLFPLGNDSDPSRTLRLLPAGDLNAGIRFCPGGMCSVSLGRSTAGFSDGERSPLSHGPLTGLHVLWRNDLGELRLTPLHRPDLAGRFYDEARRDTAAQFQRGRGPGGNDTYGHDAAFTTRTGDWDFSARIGTVRQKSTQSPFRKRDEDNLEYAGASAGWTDAAGGWLFSAGLAAEKVAGSYATLNFDTAGSPRRRIDGFALEANFGAAGHGFRFEFRGFLPEPARTSRGSKPDASDTSGYVGFGESLFQAPILAGRMKFSPAPLLCGNTPNCTGITGSRGDSVFESHAAVLGVRTGFEFSFFEVILSASLFRPVAYAAGERRPSKIGSDPALPSLIETGLELRRLSSSGAQFSFGAGRVVRRAYAGRPTKLKGENYYAAVSYPF